MLRVYCTEDEIIIPSKAMERNIPGSIRRVDTGLGLVHHI